MYTGMPSFSFSSPHPTISHPPLGLGPPAAGQSPQPSSATFMHASKVWALPSSTNVCGGSTGAHDRQACCAAQHGWVSPVSHPDDLPPAGPVTCLPPHNRPAAPRGSPRQATSKACKRRVAARESMAVLTPRCCWCPDRQSSPRGTHPPGVRGVRAPADVAPDPPALNALGGTS